MIPLMVPVISRGILFPFTKELNPRVWFITYFLTLSLFLIPTIIVKGNVMVDLPSLITKEYSETNGVLETDIYIDSDRIIYINGIELKIVEGTLYYLESNVEYTFAYLPYSKYVIDIFDERGNSLME
jgi:hypothetical protein